MIFFSCKVTKTIEYLEEKHPFLTDGDVFLLYRLWDSCWRPKENRFELHEGYPVLMSPASSDHVANVAVLIGELTSALLIKPGGSSSQSAQGRVALLGDAAHPMLPNLGQGGAQSMEDALVLSRCLDDETAAIEQALKLYEQKRVSRTSQVVRRSRVMGRLVQLENPLAIRFRNTLLRTMPARAQIKRLEWLVGCEV